METPPMEWGDACANKSLGIDDSPPAGSDRTLFLAEVFGAWPDGADFFAMRILLFGWLNLIYKLLQECVFKKLLSIQVVSQKSLTIGNSQALATLIIAVSARLYWAMGIKSLKVKGG